MVREQRPASLYIHIPFCRSKCAYCDFASYPGLEALYAPYVEAVGREMALYADKWPGLWLETVYIGGGTPTVLPLALLLQLLADCRHWFVLAPEAEVSLEANPGTVDRPLLEVLRRAGVNRLSLGVQSLDDTLLRRLGRIHTAQEAVEAFETARQAGFDNINLDLMYGLPGQTLEQWQETLRQALALRPDHLALYALTLHDETPLAQQIACGALPAPDDDLAADMYEEARRLLAEAGFRHYELSNWAALRADGTGAACSRHNLTYWLDEPYLGLGAAAHSYFENRRSWNVARPEAYIAALGAGERPLEGEECIEGDTERAEFMMLGLRLIKGVSYERFAARFGCDLRQLYAAEIADLVRLGLLEADAEGVRLTERGYLLGNEVFARFLR